MGDEQASSTMPDKLSGHGDRQASIERYVHTPDGLASQIRQDPRQAVWYPSRNMLAKLQIFAGVEQTGNGRQCQLFQFAPREHLRSTAVRQDLQCWLVRLLLALLKEYVDYSHCGEGSSFFGSVVAAGSFVVSGAGLAALASAGLSPSVATEAGVGSGDGVDSGVDSGVGVSVGGVVAFGAAVGGVVVGGAVVGAVAVDKLAWLCFLQWPFRLKP